MARMILKNVFRQIKKSFGRFFSIFAIVAIGVAFFAGVSASPSDMRNSSDCYYDDYNFMDLRLISNVGFTDDDIKALRGLDGIKGVHATYAVDAVTNIDGIQSTVRINGIPDTNRDKDNDDYINQLRIKEGSLPQGDGECVVQYVDGYEDSIKIGDVLTFEAGSDSDITETLAVTEYKVVGIVYTPNYLTFDIGTTDIGSGNINFAVMINNGNFASEYFTEVYATVEGVKELDTYSDEYFDRVEEVADRVKVLSENRFAIRVDELKKDIDRQKNEAIEEVYENVRKQVEESLTAQYKKYYPGRDVSKFVEPLIEPAYKKQIEKLDIASVEEAYDKAKTELDEKAKDWEWYVLDRNLHYSFRDYKSSAERMEAIAVVFPLFFVIVAALVCLTTMTRMVDEQRELIGTYKALGYTKKSIAMLYVLYSLIASLAGSAVGCMFGLKFFPRIIYDCWNIMYYMPDITYANHTGLSIVAVGSMTLAIVAATVFACYNELVEVPSLLMRPKAPKKGKKILLERFKFIWKHMSFSSKVSARNLFRYKKRFFMTVIGVAGGCALMVAGFGIKDSITSLIEKQFSVVIKYDLSIRYDNAAIEQKVKEDKRISDSMAVYTYTGDIAVTQNVTDKDKELIEDVTLNVISDGEAYKTFATLKERTNEKEFTLEDTGVYITEKAANDLKLKKGDKLYIENSDGKMAQVQIAEVVEMYVGHYITMSEAYYESVFNEEVTNNCILAVLFDSDERVENEMGSEYLNESGVNGMTFYSSSIDKFNKMIEALNLVTYVLIISAAALTFVVVYNLTNVNISERIREIATIKVLGFYNSETAAYVYRENILISLIGAVAGLGLGVLLHRYIMKTCELDNMMFGNHMDLSSYMIALALTMLFSVLVNVFMYGKLKKIPMVESLKSVE